jgi:hypothetical protein
LNKYKIFFHQSIKEGENSEESLIFNTLSKICVLFGGKVVDNIRLSDICIINRIEKEYFPPQIKLLNQEFLIDTLSIFKLPDLNNKKYSPILKKKIASNSLLAFADDIAITFTN